MGLCDECIARATADAGQPGLVAVGGWCAPSHCLHITPPTCYVIESKPFEDFLPQGKKLKRKRALRAFRRWQEHEAAVGTMAHGYPPARVTLPDITVDRWWHHVRIPEVRRWWHQRVLRHRRDVRIHIRWVSDSNPTMCIAETRCGCSRVWNQVVGVDL